MTSTSRRLLLAAGLLAAVIVLALGGVIAAQVALAGDEPRRPILTVYSSGEATTVHPFEYCDLAKWQEASQRLAEWEASGAGAIPPELQEMVSQTCDPQGEAVRIPVNEHSRIQISLPPEIYTAPWSLLAIYSDGQGNNDGFSQLYRPEDEQAAITLDPVDAEGRALSVVEVKLPTGIIDPATGRDEIISHATWAIHGR